MTFRQTGLCRWMTLVLTMCMLMWTASAAMGESEMTETQIAFTVVVTLGQDLSDLMVHIYGEIPASETDSANAAVQLVDEVIRRADLCFRSEGTGIAAEKLAAFDQAKEDWKTAAAAFGGEGKKFEAGLPLVDDRVADPATDAFNQIPADAQAVYLEKAEAVYRAIWQLLRPAVAAKAGEALDIQEIAELADAAEISELEEAAAEIIADVKDILSTLKDGIDVEKSEERARIEQIGSRLNSMETVVKIAVRALGIDTVSRLTEDTQ